MSIETPIHTSSTITYIEYDEEDRTLIVTFKNGSRYSYHNVPAIAHAGFLGSASKGRYHAQNIKGNYNYTKL